MSARKRLFVAGLFLLAVAGDGSDVQAFAGRRCKITILNGETTVYKSRGRTWDRTDPGTPDPKVRLQMGAQVFYTKMACNTYRPVWNETFEACLSGSEDGTMQVVDVDRVTEEVIGATEVKHVSQWFGTRVFQGGGKKADALRFGSMNSLRFKIECKRRRTCNPPPRKRGRIQAVFVWKIQPPRFLLYRVLISADNLKQYRKDAMQIQLTHWAGGTSGFTQLPGVYALPGVGQWNAFPFPLLCMRTPGAPRKRKAKVLLEIKGSPVIYQPAFGTQEVMCR